MMSLLHHMYLCWQFRSSSFFQKSSDRSPGCPLCLKGRQESDEVVHEHSKGINIYPCRVSLSSSMKNNFWWEIGACSLHSSEALWWDLLADTIVGNFDPDWCILIPLIVGIWELPHQDVLRFEVTVHKVPSMQIVQCFSNLCVYTSWWNENSY